jgi:hypothetical protein
LAVTFQLIGGGVREHTFEGFCAGDLWEIYEAENPLAEILRKVVRAAAPIEVSAEFNEWLENAGPQKMFQPT